MNTAALASGWVEGSRDGACESLTSFDADLAFLLKLKEEGRQRADACLEQNAGLLGRRSSIDLNAFV